MKQALWIMFLLVIGILTASFQLDRQSRKWPDIYVPSFAQYFSLPFIVEEQTKRGRRQGAVDAAERLVARRPVPAENLRILSQTQLASGDTQAGMTSIQLAARRGWRDRQTQEAMAELAIFSDAPAEAANRLAALIARHEDSEAIPAFADTVLSRPEGRDRMAEILAATPRWEIRFLRVASPHLEDRTLEGVLLSAHERGAAFDCGQLRGALGRITSGDSTALPKADVAALLERNCPS